MNTALNDFSTLIAPVSDKQTETSALPPILERPPDERQTILLVDDDYAIRQIVGLLLKRLGFSVVQGTNGEEGLRAFVQGDHLFAAALSDVNMPVMDGEEMLKAIRRFDPEFPVILSSGNHDPELVKRIEAYGHCAFLPKPYSTDDLHKTILALVNTRFSIPFSSNAMGL